MANILLPRRALSPFLDTPSALRPVIARHVLLGRKTQSSAVITKAFSTRRFHSSNTTSSKRLLLQLLRRNINQSRAQSTSASPPSPPLPVDTAATSPPHPSNTPPPPRQQRPSRILRALTTTTLLLFLFTAGFAMGSAPAAEAVNGYLHSPTDAESLTLYHPSTPRAASINSHIINHPLAVALRADPTMTESRPHLKIPESMRGHNLTCGPLMGEEKIEVPPLMFTSKDSPLPCSTQIFYLGPALCGHPGIVHGGLLATLLDEGLARACFPALPNKIGVTASLKIDYKAPCPGSRYVALKAETTKVEGRKAWVKGWIEVIGEEGEGDGVHVVEAEALFIEPKHAAKMVRLYGAP